jgi:hypothetical protein
MTKQAIQAKVMLLDMGKILMETENSTKRISSIISKDSSSKGEEVEVEILRISSKICLDMEGKGTISEEILNQVS